MNALETQSFENEIRLVAAQQNLEMMAESLEESMHILRGHISKGAAKFEENKEGIEKEIVGSKVIMREMVKRLDKIDHSVAMILIHYAPIGAELDGISINEKENTDA